MKRNASELRRLIFLKRKSIDDEEVWHLLEKARTTFRALCDLCLSAAQEQSPNAAIISIGHLPEIHGEGRRPVAKRRSTAKGRVATLHRDSVGLPSGHPEQVHILRAIHQTMWVNDPSPRKISDACF